MTISWKAPAARQPARLVGTPKGTPRNEGRTGEQRAGVPSALATVEQPLLDVRELSVSFATGAGPVQAVDGVSFALARGEVLAIVGESGSGKSVCAMTLMGLTRGPSTTISGSARLESRELIGASQAELRRIRGAQLAMVFQDPQSSLNPVYRVGEQIAEQIRAHEPFVSKAQALARAAALMERVGIPRAHERVRAYPHELSGGMRQRVMIAMALSLDAKVLLADEPTTALDVTVQARILAQLKQLREQEDMSIVLITHDFGVVADIADRIAVMQAGRIVEQGPAEAILHKPEHPYTRSLLAALVPPTRRYARTVAHEPLPPVTAPFVEGESLPSGIASLVEGESLPSGIASLVGGESRPSTVSPRPDALLLEVEDLRVSFGGRGRRAALVQALDGVSLTLRAGETLAIVGESGCGKTTLLRSIAGLIDRSSTGALTGSIRLQGQDLARANRRELGALRAGLGMVFQDPQASLNPRRRVGKTLARALRARGLVGTGGLDRAAAQLAVVRLLERVGLQPAHAARFPHELSGGERQRIGIARAFACSTPVTDALQGAGDPRLVLLDEPVSSLDASIRRGVIELLDELQAQLGCSYILVSHDFTTVEALADRIAVMHRGRIVELGDARELLDHPTHPYTQELLAACPRLPGGVRSDAWADQETSQAQSGPPPSTAIQPPSDQPSTGPAGTSSPRTPHNSCSA